MEPSVSQEPSLVVAAVGRSPAEGGACLLTRRSLSEDAVGEGLKSRRLVSAEVLGGGARREEG